MELADAISQFIASRPRRNAGTLQFYASLLHGFASWCAPRGATSLCDLTPPLLVAWVAHQKKIVRAITARKRAKSLRTFLLWCERERHIAEPLAHHVPIPDAEKALPKALKLSEIRRLLSADLTARDRAALYLMYDTGARLSEVCALDIRDLCIEEGTALIRKGKGNKSRIVVYSESCAAELRAYLDTRNDHELALFLNQYGDRLSSDALYRAVVHTAHSVGLEGVSPHDLRHSFATHALDADASIVDISEQLGHANLSTTMIYVHVARKGLRERHKKFSPLTHALGTKQD